MAVRAAMGAALSLLALYPFGQASAAPRSLAAHNTITAVRDGRVDVVLPRDVTLPLRTSHRAESGPAPWITFDGGGRTAGIVLIPRGSSNAVTYGLVATQFRSCRRECRERPVNALMVNGSAYRGTETLRSGLYHLYVFTDGDELTVTLDLPQLSGRTDVPIGRPSFADVRTPAVGVDERRGATGYAASASYEMKRRAGIFMAVNVMRDENYRDAHFDECLSRDHIVPDAVERPHCFPAGGFAVVRPLDPTKVQPRRGGFILTTFVGLNDSMDNVFNGDSSVHHYSFRVVSPGSMGELWSQGVLLSF